MNAVRASPLALETQYPLTIATHVQTVTRMELKKCRILPQRLEFNTTVIALSQRHTFALFDFLQPGLKFFQQSELWHRHCDHHKSKTHAKQHKGTTHQSFHNSRPGLQTRQNTGIHVFACHALDP